MAGAGLPSFQGIVGRSPLMQALFRRMGSVARYDVSVLIQGEALAPEAVRRNREAWYARVVRPLDRNGDALTVEVATRLRALSGGQRALAQRLLALIARATRQGGEA